MRTHSLTWMPFLKKDIHTATPAETAEAELRLAGERAAVAVDSAMGDAWRLEETAEGLRITGGGTGVLYGAYALMCACHAGEALPVGEHRPAWPLRMINCWDNTEGTVERGYAGRSLFFEGGEFAYDPARMRQLGRMMASVGLNVLCINNVNVHAPAHKLIEEEWLPKLAELAAIFRAYGVKLMLSIDYAHPLRDGVPTADPLDEQVAAWWKERAALVYRYVPDLAGFLVKADSENRPGPFTYNRTHADGANMLARALAPFGGKLVWRCFVYNCRQDWRDTVTDRPKAAYDTYQPLDGQFDDNVILQIKNGPYDFQVREPVSPLLLGMKKTAMAIEFQLAQEYTGQQIDLYAMPEVWQEVMNELPASNAQAVAAVSNLGRDANYFGHPFAAVNMYAYGRFAWDGSVNPAQVIRTWCRLTYALPQEQEDALHGLLMGSRGTYEKYTANLGLCWMVEPHTHYGPSPMGYEHSVWGTYHRANHTAVGIDRTAAGTGLVCQYPAHLRAQYENPATCPDRLKLFFHRLRYDYMMDDGRTLLQRLYDDHFEGAAEAEAMADALAKINLPEPDRTVAAERMVRQVRNAREWRDVMNTFFWRLTGVGDARGRKIYD